MKLNKQVSDQINTNHKINTSIIYLLYLGDAQLHDHTQVFGKFHYRAGSHSIAKEEESLQQINYKPFYLETAH